MSGHQSLWGGLRMVHYDAQNEREVKILRAAPKANGAPIPVLGVLVQNRQCTNNYVHGCYS